MWVNIKFLESWISWIIQLANIVSFLLFFERWMLLNLIVVSFVRWMKLLCLILWDFYDVLKQSSFRKLLDYYLLDSRIKLNWILSSLSDIFESFLYKCNIALIIPYYKLSIDISSHLNLIQMAFILINISNNSKSPKQYLLHCNALLIKYYLKLISNVVKISS